MEKYTGLIDLGSNTARLVIYYDDGQGVVREVDNIKQMLRLISYLDADGRITETGVQKTLECMRKFKDVCFARGVTEVTGVATAAVRQAKNGAELLHFIYEQTGIRMRLLSGEEEAHYGYLAIVNSMNVEHVITVDIGGGSTELTLIKNREQIETVSLPFGVVTLTQSFLHPNIPSQAELKRLIEFLRQQFDSLSWLRGQRCPVVAMGGTARNVAKIQQKQTQYSLSSLHHYVLNRAEVEHLFQRMSQLPLEERKTVPGLAKDRADVIIAGIAVFRTLLEIVQCEQLLTSNKGLRDGILFEQILQEMNVDRIDDVALYSTKQFMRRYRVNEAHAKHSSYLSTTIFDDLRRLQLHHFGPFERRILELSALLHDIGLSINVYETAQHTFYLLSNVLLLGLTHRERLMIAMVASYKNQKWMMQQLSMHRDILTKQDKPVIERLGSILLLARSLDRSMTQQVKQIQLTEKNKQILLTCYATKENLMEFTYLSDMLEKFSKIWRRRFQFEIYQEDENLTFR